jgi:hypothetical protein
VGLRDEFIIRDLSRPASAADVQALKAPSGEAADPRKWRKAFGGDAEGRFELFVPTSQLVEVWADGPDGSCAVSPRVRLVAGQPAELRLPAPAMLKLKVLGAKKAPLPKVTLTLRTDDRPGQLVDCFARTLELDTKEGVALQPDVPVAFKTVEVSAALHRPVERKLPLVAGQELDLGVLQLTPAARVVGRVVDARGKPAGSVGVWLGDEEIASTDGEGKFVVDGLRAGRGELRAKSDSDVWGLVQRVTLVAGAESTVELKLK